MLLIGTRKATPTPGTSICSVWRSARFVSRQVSAVTSAKHTAFSELPRNLAAPSGGTVPWPREIRFTAIRFSR